MLLLPNEHLNALPISMYLPHGRGRLRNKLADSGERTFAEKDLTVVNGVRMTTPLRTALDLGRQRWPEPALTALDALHRLGDFTIEELLSDIDRFKGMRWITTLRLVAPHTDGRSQSGGETVVRWRWKHLPVPPPEPQVAVRSRGRVAFIDVGNDDLRFGVEFQGIEWHTGSQNEAKDEARSGWLSDDEDWIIEPAWTPDVYGRNARLEDIILDGVRRAAAVERRDLAASRAPRADAPTHQPVRVQMRRLTSFCAYRRAHSAPRRVHMRPLGTPVARTCADSTPCRRTDEPGRQKMISPALRRERRRATASSRMSAASVSERRSFT